MPQWIDVHGTPQSVAAKQPHPYTVKAKVRRPKRKRHPKSTGWWGLAKMRAAYHAYLESEAWQQLKAQKAAASPKVCGGCGETGSGIQLHHMVYRKPLESARLEDLMWLCIPCHKLAHQAKDKGILRFKPDRHTPAVMAVMTKAAVKRARAWLEVPAGALAS